MPEITLLPLRSLQGTWAHIFLMGHTRLSGRITTVNVGSENCPVPLFEILEPEIPARGRELAYSEQWGWHVTREQGAIREQLHFVGHAAIFQIEPASAEDVIQRRAGGDYPVPVGKRGGHALRKFYIEALEAAGLLAPGAWTEAHQATIDACDATEDDSPKASIGDDYSLNSDPFAQEED